MTDVQQARIEAAARAYDPEAWDHHDRLRKAGESDGLDGMVAYSLLKARNMLQTADAVVTVEAITDVLDHEGAQCGNCGREPGDPEDCAGCVRVLERYAVAIQRLYRGEEQSRLCDCPVTALTVVDGCEHDQGRQGT